MSEKFLHMHFEIWLKDKANTRKFFKRIDWEGYMGFRKFWRMRWREFWRSYAN